MDYFFAGQIRSYRLQIIRAFSNFFVSTGINPDGSPQLHRVPCRYGDSQRMAETILSANSENKLPSAPFISVYVTGMSLAPERRQAPNFVDKVQVNERDYDGKYLNTVGNRYTVKRHMPVPFNMTVNVDFWTTNTQQKEEMFEQTQVLYNGMIDIQTSNNPLDWTVLTTMEPQNITWSSRSIPIGTDNPIDVMSVEYKIPIFINPPALVEYQKLIEQVIININDGQYDEEAEEWTSQTLLNRIITTPDNARIGVTLVNDGVYELQLQSEGGDARDLSNLPTQIWGNAVPSLLAGGVFTVNGVAVTIPNTRVEDLVSVMRNLFQGGNLSVRLLLNGRLEITNLSGGDVTFVNIQGAAVESMGFVATTYQGGNLAWWRLLEKYGNIETLRTAPPCEPGAEISGSEIHLLTKEDLDDRTEDLRGVIQLHPINQNILVWNALDSSWPSPTQTAITAVINPQTTYPGNGLRDPSPGDRYLLIDEIAQESVAWGQQDALPNDIIEYDGERWSTVFESQTATGIHYVKNLYSQRWLRWSDGVWSNYPQSSYRPGEWRLQL